MSTKTKMQMISVVVAGLYLDPKTNKPYDLGETIKVPENTAAAGLASCVFLKEGTVLGESAPQDTSKIARLITENEGLAADNKALTAYKDRIEKILADNDITIDDLEAVLNPAPAKAQTKAA
ncbi:hypothetical protein DES40_1724 [Litorimonas taeanensis]|uniref:Uncharacterized protein n=1 Tax=Litorimonas taeanensis TaxID=568099 RepID=A0A420WD94_9PROT|nr:hypothetical protein [Litorimonas taeanensis]RKQ68948.1 hypothetical protein DES40_1724 [Litorimonas taeanensis]